MSTDPMSTDGPGHDDRSRGVYAPGYFETRLAKDDNRTKVWRHLGDYFAQFIPPQARVLELGAGWCDFSNAISASRVVAMDIDATVEKAAGCN